MTAYDFNPRISLAVRSKKRDVSVAGERCVYGGGVRHIDGRGEVKVRGVLHC